MELALAAAVVVTPALIGGLFARVRAPWWSAPALFAAVALILLVAVWCPALDCYHCGDGDLSNGDWALVGTLAITVGWTFAVFASFVGAVFGMLLRRESDYR
jgi:hypothetical protein